MKRRNVIKGLTLLPLTGGVIGNIFPQNSVFAAPGIPENNLLQIAGPETFTADGPLTPGPQIYQSLGVDPVINCRGTLTMIGGSIERPEVRAAMDSASKFFVQYDELAEGVGRRLAELTGAEWGMVSSGCAGVLKMVTAACIAGGNPEKLHRIPNLSGMDKTEVIIPANSFSAYDFAIQNIGVKIIRVDTIEELGKALNPQTALIKLSSGSLLPGPFGLDAIAKIAKPLGIPILADAAAEILTIPNVHLQRGATMVAYSGGKALCGPQCAGLLLGPKDILMSAWQASSPHHGPGRDNKVGREEMLGMLAAVETWVKMDHEAIEKTWLSWMSNIAKRVSGIESVKTNVIEPKGLDNRTPRLTISWDPAKLNINGEDVTEELIITKPRIALSAGGNSATGSTSISISAFQMQPGEDKIVADRIYEILSRKRDQKKPEAMHVPVSDISGLWNINMEFFSGRSQHVILIEQDGNWLQGLHETDYSVRKVSGTIEGDRVMLLSAARRPAVTFIFSGTISGDTISGKIDMGEFLTAKFTGRRDNTPPLHEPIKFPTGRPMGN